MNRAMASSQSNLQVLSFYEESGPSVNVVSNKATCSNLCLDWELENVE